MASIGGFYRPRPILQMQKKCATLVKSVIGLILMLKTYFYQYTYSTGKQCNV